MMELLPLAGAAPAAEPPPPVPALPDAGGFALPLLFATAVGIGVGRASCGLITVGIGCSAEGLKPGPLLVGCARAVS
jgi:hypothetical protein